MGRLEDTFAKARADKRKLLITYLCVGDPSFEESIELAVACAEAGADILELGTPFSDPTADGPVIERASQRSLAAGGSLAATLKAAARIREKTAVPMVLFGYYNPIFVRGEEATLAEFAQAGGDALLVVDVPFDESLELRARAKKHDLRIVPLATPTSQAAYAESLRGRTDAGFLYYVSTTGVTGRDVATMSAASESAGDWRTRSGLPTVVGFGVDSGKKAREAAAMVDGVVVGSALVKCVENGVDRAARREGVTTLVRELRMALDTR